MAASFCWPFRTARSPKAALSCLSEVFARTPKDVLSANFGVSETAFDRIPKEQIFIFEAPVPPAIECDALQCDPDWSALVGGRIRLLLIVL